MIGSTQWPEVSQRRRPADGRNIPRVVFRCQVCAVVAPAGRGLFRPRQTRRDMERGRSPPAPAPPTSCAEPLMGGPAEMQPSLTVRLFRLHPEQVKRLLDGAQRAGSRGGLLCGPAVSIRTAGSRSPRRRRGSLRQSGNEPGCSTAATATTSGARGTADGRYLPSAVPPPDLDSGLDAPGKPREVARGRVGSHRERTDAMAGKVNRSAITGRFVKPSTAQRHPKTTVTETVTKKK